MKIPHFMQIGFASFFFSGAAPHLHCVSGVVVPRATMMRRVVKSALVASTIR
jgi:hypothetical protein